MVKKFDAQKHFVSKPAYEVVPVMEVKGRAHAMTLMSNALVPGSNFYIETGWIFGMPDPNPHIQEHAHDYDEMIINLGTDPKNPEDLGGEVVGFLGDEKHILNKTSAVFIPRNVEHGVAGFNRFDRPYILMNIKLRGK